MSESNSIGMCAMADLLDGRCFYVPSYQRGYRWSEDQVNKLLSDLYSFALDEDKTLYCLQPLVVKKLPDEKRWVVVDGLRCEAAVEESAKKISDVYLQTAYKRMCLDVPLYDWMLVNKKGSAFHTTYQGYHWRVSVYHSWYDHVILDTDRDRLIRDLIDCQGLVLEKRELAQKGFCAGLTIAHISENRTPNIRLIIEDGWRKIGVYISPQADAGKTEETAGLAKAAIGMEGATSGLRGDWYYVFSLDYVNDKKVRGELWKIMDAMRVEAPGA